MAFSFKDGTHRNAVCFWLLIEFLIVSVKECDNMFS